MIDEQKIKYQHVRCFLYLIFFFYLQIYIFFFIYLESFKNYKKKSPDFHCIVYNLI